jgi:hypothetical protein
VKVKRGEVVIFRCGISVWMRSGERILKGREFRSLCVDVDLEPSGSRRSASSGPRYSTRGAQEGGGTTTKLLSRQPGTTTTNLRKRATMDAGEVGRATGDRTNLPQNSPHHTVHSRGIIQQEESRAKQGRRQGRDHNRAKKINHTNLPRSTTYGPVLSRRCHHHQGVDMRVITDLL